MSTARHRALQVTTPRSCLELGVCQMRKPACQGCTCHTDEATAKALAASAQASRDTGCCFILDEEAFRESLTPMERIAYWGSVGVAVGYLSVKALGL
jgi:hypothetical protein